MSSTGSYTQYDICPVYRDSTDADHNPDVTKRPAADGLLKWSGDFPPPAVGTEVVVTINGIGPGKVLRYFSEHGWLGVRVQPHNPPEWYVKQNGRHAVCHAFGAELKLP